jgi:hypothetical protein
MAAPIAGLALAAIERPDARDVHSPSDPWIRFRQVRAEALGVSIDENHRAAPVIASAPPGEAMT